MMNQFYIAVVEDRNDPLKLGRLRVRVLNVHSEDRKTDVPIDSLPWSHVMQPPNTSTSGAPLSQLYRSTRFRGHTSCNRQIRRHRVLLSRS
jgi:hypothetical protein